MVNIDLTAETISLRNARLGLAKLWFIGTAVSFMFLVVRTMTLATNGDDVWGWYLPRISQTVLLLMHVLGANSLSRVPDKNVDRFYYRVTYGLSAFYLVLVTVVLVDEAIHSVPGTLASDFFAQHRQYLDYVQMLSATALATFFGPEHTVPSSTHLGVSSQALVGQTSRPSSQPAEMANPGDTTSEPMGTGQHREAPSSEPSRE